MGSSSYFNVHSSGAGDSTSAPSHDFGSAGGVDRADGTPLELRPVDADLPDLTAHLEFGPTELRVLEV